MGQNWNNDNSFSKYIRVNCKLSKESEEKVDGNYIFVKVGKQLIEALIDSGAACSVISSALAQQLKLKIETADEPRDRMVAATGQKIWIIGTTTMDLYYRGAKMEHIVVVVEDLTPNFVLGMNFLTDTHAQLNFSTRPPILTLFDEMVEIPMRPRCDDTNCASVIDTTVIPAYSEAYVSVQTPTHFNNSNVLLEHAECICSISVAGAVAFCKNNRAMCKVLNMNPYVVTLKRGIKLAKVLGLDKIASIQKCDDEDRTDNIPLESMISRKDLDQFHKDYGFKINPELDEDKRYEALQLLYCYKSVFARSLAEIQECKGPPLDLELNSQQKSFKRQFRLNETDKIEVNRQIADMERIGVIEPSSSAHYNSPIFLVGKKDGSKKASN